MALACCPRRRSTSSATSERGVIFISLQMSSAMSAQKMAFLSDDENSLFTLRSSRQRSKKTQSRVPSRSQCTKRTLRGEELVGVATDPSTTLGYQQGHWQLHATPLTTGALSGGSSSPPLCVCHQPPVFTSTDPRRGSGVCKLTSPVLCNHHDGRGQVVARLAQVQRVHHVGAAARVALDVRDA